MTVELLSGVPMMRSSRQMAHMPVYGDPGATKTRAFCELSADANYLQ
jgi:hypothetical protein